MNDAVNFIVKYGSCTNIIADRTMTIIHNIQELICRSEYDNHLQSSHVEELRFVNMRTYSQNGKTYIFEVSIWDEENKYLLANIFNRDIAKDIKAK